MIIELNDNEKNVLNILIEAAIKGFTEAYAQAKDENIDYQFDMITQMEDLKTDKTILPVTDLQILQGFLFVLDKIMDEEDEEQKIDSPAESLTGKILEIVTTRQEINMN